ncbi:MAG: hypothetical protein JOZ25_02765 [Actinobacteria bacterium]|nr:hypothetical protein [Actinomycetota bacterium]
MPTTGLGTVGERFTPAGGACYGFYRFERPYEVVTRPGAGGRRRLGGVLVFRSKALDGETTDLAGVPITTAERVLVDLAPWLDDKRLGRAFREAIRLGRVTAASVRRTAERHRGRRGAAVLDGFAVRYARIPYRRTRSDAEGRALEVLHDAGCPPPLVNSRIAGEEADIAWLDRRHIVEVDGPQYHRFAGEDARKAAVWRRAGFTVRRVPSDVVYEAPGELVAAAWNR